MIRFFSVLGITTTLFFLLLSFKPASTVMTEGFVSYSVEVNSDQAAVAAFLSLGSSLEVAFKDNLMKAVAKVSGNNTVSIVTDYKNQTGITLMDILGEKKGVKLTKDRFEKAKLDVEKFSKNPIRITDETKEIAGYSCKKILMKDKESGANIILYVTHEINPKNNPFADLLFEKIKGFPLGIIIKKDETTVKLTANKVTNQAPSSKVFSTSIPSDFKLTTFEEIEKIAKSKMENK